MQIYLCGATHLGGLLRHHAIIWTGGDRCSAELATVGPNVLIRRSTIGYALIEKQNGFAAVVHNIAGFITILNIKGDPRDTWQNTKIDPVGGQITQPQNVASWIMHDLLEVLIEGQRVVSQGMSERQQRQILDGIASNSAAGSLRHAIRDAQMEIIGRHSSHGLS